NKEERIPDIAQFSRRPLRKDNVLLMQAQEFHSNYWGHLDLLDLTDHFLTPDFSSYRESALSSPYPHNGVIATLAHAQHGLVGLSSLMALCWASTWIASIQVMRLHSPTRQHCRTAHLYVLLSQSITWS